MVTDIGPSNVETVAVRDSVRYSFQRKGFYARGYHWAFYYASNKIYWRKSADGITWGTATDITPSGETPTEGAEIAVWLDRHEEPAHHPYIIYADHDTDSPIYFRRATIDSAGALTWDTDPGDDHAWQTARNLIVDVSFKNITICVDDTNGYPFIGFTETTRADPGSNSTPKVIHSQQMDGTWLNEWTKQLNATNDTSWVCTVVPSGLDTICAVYARDSNQIFCQVYDISGDTWGIGEIGTGVTIGPAANKISVTSQRAGFDATLDPKCVHVVYCDSSENLQHIRITAGVITGPHLIYTSAHAMAPSISTRIYGGPVNNYRTLYVFWTPPNDDPTADIVCYKKSLDAGVNWTKENGSAGVEEWVNETSAGLSGGNTASSYFEEQHDRYPTSGSAREGYLGLLYTNKGASPDYVRWAGLEFADPDEELYGHGIIRQLTSVEVYGHVIIRHESSVELYGYAEIKNADSEELYGHAKIQQETSVELLARVEIGQDSKDLYGYFIVQYASEELYGHGIIRNANSEDLYGYFIVQYGSEDLYGYGIIRHSTSEELYGHGIILGANAEELYGYFVVQYASVELYGHGIIRNADSEELYGHTIIRNASSAELYGYAIIRHSTSVELYGHVIIRNAGSEELYGYGVIKNADSEELYGHAIIRKKDSLDLLVRFRVSTDAWIMQGLSAEVYQELTIII